MTQSVSFVRRGAQMPPTLVDFGSRLIWYAIRLEYKEYAKDNVQEELYELKRLFLVFSRSARRIFGRFTCQMSIRVFAA